MSGRPRRLFYCFISNNIGEYYSASYNNLGEPVISKNSRPQPLEYNPSNLRDMRAEFATNRAYFSLHRSIVYPFTFILDGAAILRNLDYTTNGFESNAYLTIIKYNPSRGVYELYYIGKFDFSKKRDDPKLGYTINCVDNSAWGVLSQRDDIKVQIPCSQLNPKAIKVLFDGITLKAKYVYQPVATAMDLTSYGGYLFFPISLVTTDGDAAGIVAQSENYDFTDHNFADRITEFPGNFFFRSQYITLIIINFPFECTVRESSVVGFSLTWEIHRSTGLPPIFLHRQAFPGGTGGRDITVTFNVSTSIILFPGEGIYFTCLVADFGAFSGDQISPIVTPKIRNITVNTQTKAQPGTVYALRPLDLVQQIVEKVTGGLFTIDSEYYKVNNKSVLIAGDALRNEPLAYIQSSFADWFKSFDAGDFLAMRVIGGGLWIEKADTVYDQNGDILDIGEISDVIIEQDNEHIANQIEVGSPNQDYRHSSGRLEFNTTAKFSLGIKSIKNIISLVSVYRRDGFGAEFIRLDYQGGSTKDNIGDKSVFMIDITDELGEATTFVENFQIITVDNAPLAPIMTSPSNNDIISNPSPRIRGRAPAGMTVNIYVDTVFDGSVVSDVNGEWDYNISAILAPYEIAGLTIINTGVHVINATFTDETGDLATVTITITDDVTPVRIIYPANGDNIINNKPLIKGVGQTGQIFPVILDGIIIGTITVDNSCKWEIQSPVILNGVHSLISGGTASLFSVNSSTTVPIITSFTDGFTLINNLPLIEGVAIPGTVVYLYLDYYPDVPLGTATADVHGNWSIQIVPLNKVDTTVLTPIPNGEHILSTGLTIQGSALQTTGYKLNRPAFDIITGVTDNTVFNVMLSPKRMLLARASYWASIMVQNKSDKLVFNGSDKNQALSTTIGGVTIRENADVSIESLGQGMFLPIVATFKTKVPISFNRIFNFFNAGGTIEASHFGIDLWFMPIGRMSIEDVSNDTQSWKLLFSPKTPLTSILNLYRNGLTLTIMKNAIYHSDYNPLHFVKYDFQLEQKYHAKEIYDDWFDERSERWINKPIYIQKWQTNEVIKDQIISNGVTDATLVMYRCSDATQIAIFPYNPVTPTPIPAPDIVQEVAIDLSAYPEDQYFFVLTAAETPVAISERIETRVNWLDTILFECTNSTNLTGFMYSTGIVSKLRVEGLIMKWQPDITITTNRDEIGDNQMLHSVHSKKRKILIGKASGLPDYLYLKASAFVLMDKVVIEGVEYVVDKENKLQEVDRVIGHPMYHYELDVELAKNDLGVTFATLPSSDLISVVITVDDEAFGYGGGQLMDIEVKGE